MNSTPLITFFGGPGTGKSTTAAMTFARLKYLGRNVEYVHEFAKELTWEDRSFALGHQPLIAATQMAMYDRLAGKVEAVITDTSPLLSIVYSGRDKYPRSFFEWLVMDFRSRNTINYFLSRDPEHAYSPHGRSQTEEQAKDLDSQIRTMLVNHGIAYTPIQVGKSTLSHIDEILEDLAFRL